MSAQSLTFAAARAAAAAARTVDGVLGLSGGALGEFATYGTGDRVPGVRVRTGMDPSVTLKLVVAYGRQLPELADEVRDRVRSAVAPLLGRADLPVDLDIVDVRLPRSDGPPVQSVRATSAFMSQGE